MKTQIVMATPADTEAVLRLYRQQVGRPLCFWTEDYPGRDTIEFDLSRDGLFVMILGFLAVGLSVYFYVLAQSRIGAARTSISVSLRSA